MEPSSASPSHRRSPPPRGGILGFKTSPHPGTEWLSGASPNALDGARCGRQAARHRRRERGAHQRELGSERRQPRPRHLTYALPLATTLWCWDPTRRSTALGRQIRLDLRLQDAVRGIPPHCRRDRQPRPALRSRGRVGKRCAASSGAGRGEPREVRAALPSTRNGAALLGRVNSCGFRSRGARDPARAVTADPTTPWRTPASPPPGRLGYDGKAREGKGAYDLAADLPREERLLIEGRYLETVPVEAATESIGPVVPLPGHLDTASAWRRPDLVRGRRGAGDHGGAAQPAAAVESEAGSTSRGHGRRRPGRLQAQEAAAGRARGQAQSHGAPLMVAQARLLECRAQPTSASAESAPAAEGAGCTRGRRPRRVAEALTHAANVLYDRGDLDAASRLYEEALATYHEIGNRGGEAGARNNIAVVLKSRGDLVRARQLYEEVLAICREVGSRSGEAYALNNLAGVLLRRGELDQAGELFAQALAIRREQGDKRARPTRSTIWASSCASVGISPRHAGSTRVARTSAARSARRSARWPRSTTSATVPRAGGARGARASTPRTPSSYAGRPRQSASAYALCGLAEVLARQGDLAGARQRDEAASTSAAVLGEKATVAESQAALPRCCSTPGMRRAPRRSRGTPPTSSAAGSDPGQAVALTTLAQAAARGGMRPAREAIDRAAVLAGSGQDPAPADRPAPRRPAPPLADAGPALQAVLAEASRAACSTAARGRIALAGSTSEAGGGLLAAVQQEAKALGMA